LWGRPSCVLEPHIPQVHACVADNQHPLFAPHLRAVAARVQPALEDAVCEWAAVAPPAAPGLHKQRKRANASEGRGGARGRPGEPHCAGLGPRGASPATNCWHIGLMTEPSNWHARTDRGMPTTQPAHPSELGARRAAVSVPPRITALSLLACAQGKLRRGVRVDRSRCREKPAGCAGGCAQGSAQATSSSSLYSFFASARAGDGPPGSPGCANGHCVQSCGRARGQRLTLNENIRKSSLLKLAASRSNTTSRPVLAGAAAPSLGANAASAMATPPPGPAFTAPTAADDARPRGWRLAPGPPLSPSDRPTPPARTLSNLFQ
jgi:hypothetical protein